MADGPWEQFQAGHPADKFADRLGPWQQFQKPQVAQAQTQQASAPKSETEKPGALNLLGGAKRAVWNIIKTEVPRIAGGMLELAKKPGEFAASKEPVTTGEMIPVATEMALSTLRLGKTPFEMGRAPVEVEKPSGIGNLSKEFIGAQEDALHNIGNQGEADKIRMLQTTDALPPEAKNPAVQEKFYNHIENPSGVKLDPAEQTLFDATIKPLQEERAQIYNKITEAGYPLENLTSQVHRVVKGKSPHFDVLEGIDAPDPIMGVRSLPRTTSSLQERKFYALKDSEGNRFVVSKGESGGTVWRDGKATEATIPHDIEPGNSFSVGDKRFTVEQATTKEIEENTPVRYYKNAWANTVDDVIRLRRVARAIDYLDTLKKMPEWQKFATADPTKIPRGWIRTQLPQLNGWYMDPKIAHVFDDFYGHGRGNLAETLAKVNRFATRSLFWNPNPHIENVMGHWVVGRGWDWITPHGVRSLMFDGAKAIKSVVTLDKTYQKMLKEGAGLQAARVANQEFYQQLAKKIGMEFQKDPGRWGNIFKTMGFNGLADGIASYYGAVSKILWQANDVFLVQRALELERHGMPLGKAIREAEKHIPNYRIPSQVMGTRAVSELLQNPNIFVFTRYHYGVFKSYANMVKDLYGGTPKEKFDALGNLLMLGVLTWVIYPLLSEGLAKLTGNPETKKLARGPAAIPSGIQELYSGDRSLPMLIGNIMTLAPGTKEIGEQLTQKDWFTGKDIVEPADLRHHRWGRVAAQIINHAGETSVSPYQVLDEYVKDADAKSAVREVIDRLVGMKEPTQRQLQGKKAAQAIQDKEAAKRAKRPRGVIEKIPNYGGPQQ